MRDDPTVDELKRRLVEAEQKAAAAEAALAVSESKLRRALEAGRMDYWEWDPQDDRVRRSNSLGDLKGLGAAEGWHSAAEGFTLLHPEDRARHVAMVEAARRSRTGWHAEVRIISPENGETRWMEERAAAVIDPLTGDFRIVGFTWDITGRKRIEATLRDSDERLRRVLDGMTEGFGILDPNFIILEHNREALRLNGRRREELIGRSHWEAYPHSEHSEVGTMLKTAMSRRIPTSLEHRYAWEEGRARWLEMRAYPAAGGALAVFWHDVTDRREVADSLRDSEARYRTLFESMEEAYAVVEVLKDDDGRWADFRFLEVNPAFIVHTSIPSPVGKTATELLGTPNPRWIRLYGQALDTGMPIRVEEDEPTLGRTFDLNIFPLDRDQNRVAGLFTNVTARKQTEMALRDSEARFQQFANASDGALWIRDAATLDMEYVSQAAWAIYGVRPDDLLGDIKTWAALVVPEDRQGALEHVERVRAGNTERHEFRIQRPGDQAFRWVRNSGFPLLDSAGRVERVGGIFADVTEAKLAIEHQGVLLAELQHRVRNIMAMIRSITARTAERAESVAEYAELMSGRLLALARVQALLTRAADARVSIGAVVHDEVKAQSQHEGQYDLEGPYAELSPKAAEVLTLAIHELATNALKYGAFSAAHGKVTVRWLVVERTDARWLIFDWSEEGAPRESTDAAPRRHGFGSELIEARIPYELGGRGELSIGAGGARCHLEFPLKEGASILETGAPQRATVFGGMLDMTGEPKLEGQRVLVVEDDYYLATDAARALRGAGANVVGVCPTGELARAVLDQERPAAVVLDINLGKGATFDLARELKARGVPFVFVTGYDRRAIPEEFKDVARLEKPVQPRQIAGAVAKLLGR